MLLGNRKQVLEDMNRVRELLPSQWVMRPCGSPSLSPPPAWTQDHQGGQIQQIKMQGAQLNLNVRKTMSNIFLIISMSHDIQDILTLKKVSVICLKFSCTWAIFVWPPSGTHMPPHLDDQWEWPPGHVLACAGISQRQRNRFPCWIRAHWKMELICFAFYKYLLSVFSRPGPRLGNTGS